MRLPTQFNHLKASTISALLITSVGLLYSCASTAQRSQSDSVVAQPAQPASTLQSNSQDQEAIRQRLQEFRQLYDTSNGRRFTFEGSDIYLDTDELTAYDDLAPKDTQIRGWNTYRPLWETVINDGITNQQFTQFNIDRVETSGDLGWSGITVRFRAKNKGKDFYTSQHLTHIWHRVNGRWRIVHEHAFSPVKVNGQPARP